MTRELDLVAMFEGLKPNEARELTERIAMAVIQTYEDFKASRVAGSENGAQSVEEGDRLQLPTLG